jgi:hypothetical protein
MYTEQNHIKSNDLVLRLDNVPGIWQFLKGLHVDDLITELIQNDLDAGATHTKIEFGRDRLICQGNGTPVDENGWRRLTYFTGAGDRVPEKKNSFGVKNHGLKACFTIGDDIWIRSDGKVILQTLYKDGPDNKPSPATYRKPKDDEDAPATGCRIEVPYRRKQLITDVGETLSFPPLDAKETERIFHEACHAVTRRFIAVIRPNERTRYTLELSHHSLGGALFEFKLGTSRTFAYSWELYNRSCKVQTDVGSLPAIEDVQEQFYLFPLQLNSDFTRDIPSFFKHPEGFLVEISWPLSKNGKPQLGQGRRRYPIEYPGGAQNVLTGNGFSISAPYVSDRERHGIADDKFNDYVDSSCIAKMIMILRRELMLRHGVKSLHLLVWSKETDEDIIKKSVANLIEQRALPLGSPSTKYNKKSGKKAESGKGKPYLHFGPRRVKGQAQKRIILPVWTEEPEIFSHLLSALCPSNEDQIHAKLPDQFFAVLRNNEFDSGEVILIFDESDVIDRFTNEDEAVYPWQDEKERVRQLCNPKIAEMYLSCIDKYCIDIRSGNQDKIDHIKTNGILPDTYRKPVNLSDLYAGKQIPDKLPVQNTPPIIHPDISNHSLFKKKHWKLNTYKFGDFLDDLSKALPSEDLARSFWKWLEKNQKKVPRRSWGRLTTLPIWPGNDGKFYPFESLCNPIGSSVSKVLRGYLIEPHSAIYRIKPIKNARKGKLRIRTNPYFSEIASFVHDRLNQYSLERTLSVQERDAFHQFENDIVTLSRYSPLCREHLNQISSILALNEEGFLKPIKDIVLITEKLRRLCLLDEYVLSRKNNRLNEMTSWRASEKPTAEQILKTLQEDPKNKEVLLPRLQHFISARSKEKENKTNNDIGEIACIPVGTDFCKPNQLAFKGRGKGDYWGEWKRKISGQAISAEVQQDIYLKIGVISAEPSRETSQEFFTWLSQQAPKVIEAHLQQTIRHIGHNRGKTVQWCKDHPDIPFIPFKLNNSYGLASYREAASSRFRLFIPDFPAMVDAIEDRNTANIRLAITSFKRVKMPIDVVLKSFGLKSLKEKSDFPHRVKSKNIYKAPNKIQDYLVKLRSEKMKDQLLKRLTNFDIDIGSDLLHTKWKAHLSEISEIKTAEDLEGVFKLYNCNYTASIDSAFVKSSGIIWLKHGPGMLDGFFNVIADLIFVDPKKYITASLQKVIDSEIREDSWIPSSDLPDDEWDDEADDIDDSFGDDDDHGDVTEKKKAHIDIEDNPDENTPDPSKLPEDEGNPTTGGTTTKGTTGGSGNGKGGSRGTSRVESKKEKRQKEALKKDHYAYHCQICLAGNKPDELAPATSYVANSNHRKRIIEASHIDPVHGQGARHAGNMLILCAYHHHKYGDTMSRQDVIDSLKSPDAIDTNVNFSVKKDGVKHKKSVKGKVTSIKLPLSGKEVHCFFTRFHADYWLEKSDE